MAKSKVTVVPATKAHIDYMKGRFRKADDDECRATTGFSVDTEVDKSIRLPGLHWAGLSDGVPFCVFGVTARSVLCSTGTPWLLGTEDTRKNWVQVLKLSRPYVAKMIEYFDRLENYVDVRNTMSIKWLKWCGFKLDTPEPYGILGLPFHRFSMTKEDRPYV